MSRDIVWPYELTVSKDKDEARIKQAIVDYRAGHDPRSLGEATLPAAGAQVTWLDNCPHDGHVEISLLPLESERRPIRIDVMQHPTPRPAPTAPDVVSHAQGYAAAMEQLGGIPAPPGPNASRCEWYEYRYHVMEVLKLSLPWREMRLAMGVRASVHSLTNEYTKFKQEKEARQARDKE